MCVSLFACYSDIARFVESTDLLFVVDAFVRDNDICGFQFWGLSGGALSLGFASSTPSFWSARSLVHLAGTSRWVLPWVEVILFIFIK